MENRRRKIVVEYRKDERGTRARERYAKEWWENGRGVGIRAGEWSRTCGEKRGGETGRRDVMFLRAGWEKLSVTSSEAVSFRRCTPIRYDVFPCKPCVHIYIPLLYTSDIIPEFREFKESVNTLDRDQFVRVRDTVRIERPEYPNSEFLLRSSVARGCASLSPSLSRVQVNVFERIKGFDRNKRSAWCYCQVMVPDEKTIDQVLWSM